MKKIQNYIKDSFLYYLGFLLLAFFAYSLISNSTFLGFLFGFLLGEIRRYTDYLKQSSFANKHITIVQKGFITEKKYHSESKQIETNEIKEFEMPEEVKNNLIQGQEVKRDKDNKEVANNKNRYLVSFIIFLIAGVSIWIITNLYLYFTNI